MAKVTDFAAELSERYGLSADEATNFITLMFDVVREQLDSADKQVKVKGLGTFKVTSVGARASVDVNTGERIMLEGRNKISFTPEVLLRDRVNRPFVQFETVVLNDGVDFSEIDREYNESKEKEEPAAETDDARNDDAQEADAEDEPNEDERETETEDEREQEAEDDSEADDADEREADDADEPSEDEQEPSGDGVQQDAENHEDAVSAAAPEENNAAQAAGSDETESADSGNGEHVDTPAPESVDAAEPSEPTDAPAVEKAAVSGEGMACKQRNPRLMYWLSAASFVLLVCIGVGMYFLYRQMDAKNQAIEQLQTRLAVHAQNVKALSDSAKRAPAAAEKVAPVAVAKEAAKSKADTVKAKPKEQTPPANETATKDYSYDARIRTGAYVIVGTDRTVTLKDGQTLQSVSKTYLGPGMECYVEVYNNCKDAKPGDKLKIPKLKLKKIRQ